MATLKQKRAAKAVAENGGNVSKAMRDAGYSPQTAKTPRKLTESDGWKELMGKHLSDEKLAEKHEALLNSHSIEHMVFPLNVTDEEITEILAEVNCIARRFQHSETQTHVWFWSPDNKARKDAIDMAYKLKGRYSATKVSIVDPYGELEDDDLEAEIARRHSNSGTSKKSADKATG